jgi:hypothetical protein
VSYKNKTDGWETVFTKLSGASGLFVDLTIVYVQAFGVFGLEITKWALCCWKHWGRGW